MTQGLFEDIPDSATISEIRPLPRDPNIRSIRVGRRVVARLRASDVQRLGLTPGQPWTRKLAQRVQEAISLAKARKEAFTMLGRKALSRAEMIARLSEKQHPPDIVEATAHELVSDGWLDDANLARELIDHHRAKKPAGSRLLREKLRQRGIPEEVAEQAIQEKATETNPVEEAIALARKRLQSMGSLPAPTAARRIAGLLHRRGFDPETTEAALNRMGLIDND